MKDLMGNSFVACLDCLAGGRPGVVALSQQAIAGQSGWLETSHLEDRAVPLHFTFLSSSEGRFLYAITGAETAGYYAKAALGTSLNGYLGMYHLASVQNVWKFDFDDTDGEDFRLRDKDGYRVAVDDRPQDGAFYLPADIGNRRLSVTRGEIARFALRHPRTLG